MWQEKYVNLGLVVLFLLVTFGCGYPISENLRREAQKNLSFSTVFQDPLAHRGTIVIWGGKIIKTFNRKQGSEILVLQIPLNWRERPEEDDSSRGRFIAKSSGYLDAAVYTAGRKITVAGEIVGKETWPVGEIEYTYPVVMIKEIHLWPKEKAYFYPPPDYYWGWGYPYGDWGFSPRPYPYGWWQGDEGERRHEEREREEDHNHRR